MPIINTDPPPKSEPSENLAKGRIPNILLMLAVPGGVFGISLLCGSDVFVAARAAISALFLFTAFGHFAKPKEMIEIIPPWVPLRKTIVFSSGIFELLLAVGISVSSVSPLSLITAIVFLFLATPLNIYAAYHRRPLGGHPSGPKYLFIRLPLQVMLILWVYWLYSRS